MELGRFVDSLSIKAGFLAILALGGCIATTLPYMRTETAQRIAAPAWMIKRDIPAGTYTLRAYERIHDRAGFANVYIEGDGEEYTNRVQWEIDPTPTNPVALHLASKDRAENVIYLARPCQYTGTASGENCPEETTGTARYSKDVVSAYNTALDEIARRYDISGFHLIGYSGGAAVAALISSERNDILSLRTLSGILDHKTHRQILGSTPLDKSLNPSDSAHLLTRVPQYHFIGGQDNIVPPAVLNSYLQASPPSRCIQTMIVQEAEYDAGWVDKWPELLDLPVTCYNQEQAIDYIEEITPATTPHTTGVIFREKPAKP